MAFAQTPASNPTPDGSREMDIGLGVQAAPRHAGVAGHCNVVSLMLQAAWRDGLPVCAMGAELCRPASPVFADGPTVAPACRS